MQLVVLSLLVFSVGEEEKKLLAAAHAVVHDSQRKLHAISEEARLVYQQRLGERERCRRAVIVDKHQATGEGERAVAAGRKQLNAHS